VTVEVGVADGDGVVDPDFRAFATRTATMTITTIAMMTRMMLRNVWSGRSGGPDGEPHPCWYGGPGGRPHGSPIA
jgi:hypothetical protein